VERRESLARDEREGHIVARAVISKNEDGEREEE
jgi:hypothetical protein